MAERAEDWIAAQPEDRRELLQTLRKAVVERLPAGYEERLSGSMLHYVVPHELFPQGYHCNPKQPLAYVSLANTKGHVALHLPASIWIRHLKIG